MSTLVQGDSPSIAVLLPTVWSVRNVVHGGVLDHLLDEGVAARLFLRRLPAGDGDPFALRSGSRARYDTIIVPEARRVRGKAMLDAVVRSAFSRRRGIASYEIYRRWYHRADGTAERARGLATELLGAIGQTPIVFDGIVRAADWMYQRQYDISAVRAQLERDRPDLVWSTFCVSAYEYPYIMAARELGIPVVTSILSFDNLTSRGRLPDFDHYMVWCEGMRDQLLRLYPYVDPERVTITGTPQFDFHRRPEFLWSRERTLDRLGIPSDSRYVLYSTSAEVLAPDEPELVSRMAAYLREHGRLKDHWIVVRLHPLDDGRRWKDVAIPSARVVLSSAWDEWPDADGWTLSSRQDQARLVSTLAHSDACVNVASTMSLDAAILDRPVINIDFLSERDAPRDILYEEYDADHYRPLVESGGVSVAHGWEELATLLDRAVADPGRDRELRAGMVRRECGVVDGSAASRVTGAIVDQLRRARGSARDAGRRLAVPA